MNDRYYDRQGNPITRDEWSQRLIGDEHRHVARDTLDSGAEVSTVWLGLDHRWGDDGPPLIFETMVFNGPFDGEQERYSTEAEAIAGHAAMIASVREREAEYARSERLRDAAPRLAEALKQWQAWAEEWGDDILGSLSISPDTHDELLNLLDGTNAALREAGIEP